MPLVGAWDIHTKHKNLANHNCIMLSQKTRIEANMEQSKFLSSEDNIGDIIY